mmetsp:Transcript_7686/g.21318  ORF Transcript_7686/g.21318 Transcript_7686/m.21318 type:complete len:236 (+) Transcript_7686:39-746(+)
MHWERNAPLPSSRAGGRRPGLLPPCFISEAACSTPYAHRHVKGLQDGATQPSVTPAAAVLSAMDSGGPMEQSVVETLESNVVALVKSGRRTGGWPGAPQCCACSEARALSMRPRLPHDSRVLKAPVRFAARSTGQSDCALRWELAGEATHGSCSASAAVGLAAGLRVSSARRNSAAAGEGCTSRPAAGLKAGSGVPARIVLLMLRSVFCRESYGKWPHRRTYARTPRDQMSVAVS